MAEKPESDAFLAGVDAKIAALQQLRESYLAALSVGAVGQSAVDVASLSQPGIVTASGGQSAPSGSVALPTGVFRDKGLVEAIRLYLSIARKKQTLKEIQTALLEGGLATTAEKFEPTLSGTLYRMKRNGELLQFKEGWDLAASYPESFRQRVAQSTESAPKAKRKTKKKKVAGVKSERRTATVDKATVKQEAA